MGRVVKPGEFYRHFKGNLYQIMAVAQHSETGEQMVVYQALYGTFAVYVRPYEDFVSEVDHEKYPDVVQRYRFMRVEPTDAGEEKACSAAEEGQIWRPAAVEDGDGRTESMEPNPDFLRFLDADSCEERVTCLKRLARTATQQEMDSIFLVLDMKPERGSIEEQAWAAIRFLNMQRRYDGGHLR